MHADHPAIGVKIARRNTMMGCNIDTKTAIGSAIRRWQDWRISRQTECCEGIPVGLPYLTGWVQHFAVAAAIAETD